ncbi:MAG: hypothetical protein JRG90_08190 [Deltaproteobacteria bacterium]|nr:hypothetical protein [Deltaproteobacteria bacterium]MBW2667775.1 hypothetical protein [Deltaproteobacteria bacterium]
MSESKPGAEDTERTGHWNRKWLAVATVVCLAGFAVAFGGYWGSDPSATVPIPSRMLANGDAPAGRPKPVIEADYRMAVWAVGRNARALIFEPTRLFQAEPCHPVPNALALHHPVITPALIAAPVAAMTGDPAITFNAAVLLKVAIGFAAMVLLVWDWTRSPPAAIVAGLLYAFHPAQIEHPHHLFTSDNAWMLFGVFFARRLFERGRWLDAVGLSAACLLQMGASFYPFFAATLAAVPLLAWLCWCYGVKAIPVSRGIFVAVSIAGGAALIFAPYLNHAAAEFTGRGRVFYAPWSTFLPGGNNAMVGLTALLAIAAFALGRDRVLAGLRGDPRAALAIAALLIAAFATGGNYHARISVLSGAEPPPFVLPNLFAALSGWLPGLRNVRLPGEFALATRAMVCLLAGLGAAGLLNRLPERLSRIAAPVLILLAFTQTPGLPGFSSGTAPRFGSLTIRPPEDALTFFDALAESGNDGPLLELPIDRTNRGYTFRAAPEQQLLSAYHHRRTSGCYFSFIPQRVRALAELSRELPENAALDRARELGFTTVIVHHGPRNQLGRATRQRFDRAIETGSAGFQLIATSPNRTAYALDEASR